MRVRPLATILLGLLAAGCQSAYSQNAPGAVSSDAAPQGPPYHTDPSGNRIVPSQNHLGPSVPPYRLDQYNNRVDAEGYRVDGTGNRMAVQGPYYTMPSSRY